MKNLSLLIVLTIVLSLLIGFLVFMIVYLEKQITCLIDKVNNLSNNTDRLDTRLRNFTSETTKYFVEFNDALVKEYNILTDINDVHKESAERIYKLISESTSTPKKKTTKINIEKGLAPLKNSQV